MKIKKNTRLIIAALTIVTISGFLISAFETSNDISDYKVMNSPKLSSSIVIITPDSFTSWNAGDSQWIVFGASIDIVSVNITLYLEGIYLGSEYAIDEWTVVTGKLFWNIPEDLEPSDQYQIKISDYFNQSFYVMSPFFEIEAAILGLATSGLGDLGPTVVIIGLGVIISLCITNRIVRKMLLNKRRTY